MNVICVTVSLAVVPPAVLGEESPLPVSRRIINRLEERSAMR